MPIIRKFFNRWFRNVLCLLILGYFYPGFEVTGGLTYLFLGSLLLFFIQLVLQPILKVLFIPVNLVTLGMFRWLILTVHLLIVVYVFEPLRFTAFDYRTIDLVFFTIPQGHVTIIFSVLIGSIFYRFIRKAVIYLT